MMRNLLRDLRYGARSLLRKPLFSAVVIIVLSLGIGANTAIFTVVYAVLLRPLPYDEPERILMITETDSSGDQIWAAPADYIDGAAGQSFEAIAAMRWWSANLTGGSEPEVSGALVYKHISGAGCSANFGPLVSSGECKEGQGNVVVIELRPVQRRLVVNLDIIGKTASFNGIAAQSWRHAADFTTPVLNIGRSYTD